MIPIPDKCYVKRDDKGKSLVCEERGRKMVFHNPNRCALDQIRVDGCVIKQETACDYLVLSEDRHHFVELKGRHVMDAYRQLEATIPRFIEAGSSKPIWCFVVSTKNVPAMQTGIQAAERRISRKWNARFRRGTNYCEHEIA